MKRTAIRLEDIASWHNLARAVERAARGKRYRPEVVAFVSQLDRNLAMLRTGILNGTVPVGQSAQFHIRDPKPRVIHAPCFRERVLHHAIMAHVGPVLDRALIDDTFACRTGKGMLAAVRRCQHHIRRFPWYAKLDVRQYFASIDHGVLKHQLRHRLKSAPLLALLDRIIDAHHVRPGKGLPIGALTSQIFANFYLNPLDRFLMQTCRIAALVRYMDDFVCWDGSKQRAGEVVRRARDFLRLELDLTVKETWQINQSARGLPMCGYRIFPGTIRLARSRRQRYIRVKRYWERQYRAGRISARMLQAGFDAALAITAHADAKAWRRRQALEFSSAMWYEDV
ncbi:RNA-directed DNA polymerase [Candidatus Entotheonella palauensis]|uniref:RNA-directed DNA polymerase n=1 Tax=Candidatus Entotheonella palauensis TaxID=93172 RepID=UPI0015C46644|nr:RNA-directed DNA polymerase [Candidatus Entotheonella palauensis]